MIVVISLVGVLLSSCELYRFYEKEEFLENESAYTRIAKLYYEDYKQYNINAVFRYFTPSENGKVQCVTDEHSFKINYDDYKNYEKIKKNYRLDKQTLEFIYVYDGFVSFVNINGRESYIYSVDDEEPMYINDYSDKNKSYYYNISVRKMVDHWYYARHY